MSSRIQKRVNTARAKRSRGFAGSMEPRVYRIPARTKPRPSDQPCDKGLLHDLRFGFEATAAPVAIAAE